MEFAKSSHRWHYFAFAQWSASAQVLFGKLVSNTINVGFLLTFLLCALKFLTRSFDYCFTYSMSIVSFVNGQVCSLKLPQTNRLLVVLGYGRCENKVLFN